MVVSAALRATPRADASVNREINVTSVVRFIACICALDYIDFINQASVLHLVEGHCGVFRFSKHRHTDDAVSDRTYSIKIM